MPRPPSIQWYYKQWLGDNKVQGMEWDAYGMHFHLINLSIQEEPPGSLPNDMVLIRRWLRNPPDDVWRRVQPQVFSAWTLRGDRWFNTGTTQAIERRERYLNRNVPHGTVPHGTVLNQNETGTKNRGDPMPSVNKEVSSSFEYQKQRVFLEIDEEASPDFLPVSALAMGHLGKMQMPSSVANIRTVANAIETVAHELNLSDAKANDWLLHHARAARKRGKKVNRFWYEDGMQTWVGELEPESETCERCGGPKWIPSKLVRGQVKECECRNQ